LITSDRIWTNSIRSPGKRGLDFCANVVDDLEDRARPLIAGLEASDDIAGVLLRREQAELGTGAT